MAVEIKGGSSFEQGAPKELFLTGAINIPLATPYQRFDVSADGQRFLIIRPSATLIAESAALPIAVVVNWTAGLGQ